MFDRMNTLLKILKCEQSLQNLQFTTKAHQDYDASQHLIRRQLQQGKAGCSGSYFGSKQRLLLLTNVFTVTVYLCIFSTPETIGLKTKSITRMPEHKRGFTDRTLDFHNLQTKTTSSFYQQPSTNLPTAVYMLNRLSA